MAPNVCWVSSETCRSASHAEGNRGIDEIAPVPVVAVVQMRGVVERQPHAFKRDQAVRELVLDRLEFARSAGRTAFAPWHNRPRGRKPRARRRSARATSVELGLEQPVIEKRGRQIDTARRRVLSGGPRKVPRRPSPGSPPARRRVRRGSTTVTADASTDDDEVCAACGDFDKAQQSAGAVHPTSSIGARALASGSSAPNENATRAVPVMQPVEQINRGFGVDRRTATDWPAPPTTSAPDRRRGRVRP